MSSARCWLRRRRTFPLTGPSSRALETSAAAHEADRASIVCAAVNEQRTHGDWPEHDDAVEAEERSAQMHLSVDHDPYGVVVEMQRGPGREHIQRVEQFKHRTIPRRPDRSRA